VEVVLCFLVVNDWGLGDVSVDTVRRWCFDVCPKFVRTSN